MLLLQQNKWAKVHFDLRHIHSNKLHSHSSPAPARRPLSRFCKGQRPPFPSSIYAQVTHQRQLTIGDTCHSVASRVSVNNRFNYSNCSLTRGAFFARDIPCPRKGRVKLQFQPFPLGCGSCPRKLLTIKSLAQV